MLQICSTTAISNTGQPSGVGGGEGGHIETGRDKANAAMLLACMQLSMSLTNC